MSEKHDGGQDRAHGEAEARAAIHPHDPGKAKKLRKRSVDDLIGLLGAAAVPGKNAANPENWHSDQVRFALWAKLMKQAWWITGFLVVSAVASAGVAVLKIIFDL